MKENNDIDYALSQIGIIKKTFQQERARLITEGVNISNKAVWQAIHDAIWLLKKRQKRKNEPT